MTAVKRKKLVLTVLHVLGAVFALVVLGISAAAIDQMSKAANAVNQLNQLKVRKLLGSTPLEKAAGAILTVSFAQFLNFTLFVAIVGFLLSGLLALCYLKPVVYDKTLGALTAKSAPSGRARWPFYELVIACVWSVFWLAAAAAASDSPLARISGYCSGVSSCDQINAVVALSWLSWLVWLAVVVLTAVEYGITSRRARKTHAAAGAAGTTDASAKPADGKNAQGAVEMAQPA